MIKRVVGLHFSPRGGTAMITERIAKDIAAHLNNNSASAVKFECFDLVDCAINHEQLDFNDETIVVVGMPAYVGKIPLPAIKILKCLQGGGAMTITVVSYGNNNYGNSLYELYNYVDNQGFVVVGAGAFVTRHGRKDILVRPDNEDAEAISDFCKSTANKLIRLAGSSIDGLKIKPVPLTIHGKMPIHRISRIAPKAAATAQMALEKANLRRKEPEWFL